MGSEQEPVKEKEEGKGGGEETETRKREVEDEEVVNPDEVMERSPSRRYSR